VLTRLDDLNDNINTSITKTYCMAECSRNKTNNERIGNE